MYKRHIHSDIDKKEFRAGSIFIASENKNPFTDLNTCLLYTSNQLLAAMVLISLSVFLKVTGRKGFMLYIPMCTMLVVTLSSLGPVSYTHLYSYL